MRKTSLILPQLLCEFPRFSIVFSNQAPVAQEYFVGDFSLRCKNDVGGLLKRLGVSDSRKPKVRQVFIPPDTHGLRVPQCLDLGHHPAVTYKVIVGYVESTFAGS